MLTLNYGDLPTNDQILAHFTDDVFELSFGSDEEYQPFQRAVNQGIDSHLEAVDISSRVVPWYGMGEREIFCVSRESLHTLIRRLVEDGENDSLDLASVILSVIGIEWI